MYLMKMHHEKTYWTILIEQIKFQNGLSYLGIANLKVQLFKIMYPKFEFGSMKIVKVIQFPKGSHYHRQGISQNFKSDYLEIKFS